VREELGEWNAGKGGFLLSIRSRRNYYKLRDALRVAKMNKELSDNDLEEIWLAKNSFRKSLRVDLSLIYSEEKLPEVQTSERKK